MWEYTSTLGQVVKATGILQSSPSSMQKCIYPPQQPLETFTLPDDILRLLNLKSVGELKTSAELC